MTERAVAAAALERSRLKALGDDQESLDATVIAYPGLWRLYTRGTCLWHVTGDHPRGVVLRATRGDRNNIPYIGSRYIIVIINII